MHRGGEVFVNEPGVAVADHHIAIGSVADRCLLSGVKHDHFRPGTTSEQHSSHSLAALELQAAITLLHRRRPLAR